MQVRFNNIINNNSYVNSKNVNFTSNKSVPQFSTNTLSQDTLELSTKKAEKKEGSKVKKYLLAALATTLAVAGVVTAVKCKNKGNIGSTEFKDASSIKDAIKYGEKTLGVQYMDSEKASLDTLNTVNKWLSDEKKLNNKIPNIISFEEGNVMNPLGLRDVVKYQGKDFNSLTINLNTEKNFDDVIKNIFEHTGNVDINNLITRSNGTYQVANQKLSNENVEKLVQKLNNYSSKSSYSDKMEIYDGLSEAISYLSDIKNPNAKMKSFSSNGGFLHEMGHLNHQYSYANYSTAHEKGSEIFKEFKSENNQKIAKKFQITHVPHH